METHWKNVMSLLVGGVAACRVAASALTEITTIEDLPELLHELLTTYAVNASLTTRTYASHAVRSIVSKFSGELLTLLSTGNGEARTLK